jgi:hypothetical protein
MARGHRLVCLSLVRLVSEALHSFRILFSLQPEIMYVWWMTHPPHLTIVPESEEAAPTKDVHWTILKRKTDPKTRTEVVIKLDGKERHLFMTKPDEEEQEITSLFNVYDKRVFENVFQKLMMKKL